MYSFDDRQKSMAGRRLVSDEGRARAKALRLSSIVGDTLLPGSLASGRVSLKGERLWTAM